MKKLMIALAVVAMAACTQAASMKWKATVASLSKVDASYEGYNIYLCESLAADGFESEADIANYLYGTSDNTGVTAKSGSRSPYAYTTGTKTARGISADDEGLKTVYAVIVSKDGQGYWSMAAEGEVYTTATEPKVATFDAAELIKGNYTKWNAGPGPDPTPEPTTGLLMLVGLAGLALRRKRA